MDFLEDYYFLKPHPPYLLDAVHAVSLSHMGTRVKELPWLATKAKEYRGKALRALSKVLEDSDQARSDDVLISFFLIERAEVCPLPDNVICKAPY